MPEFTYTARSTDGRFRSGVLISSGAGEAVNNLRSQGWLVLDLKAAGSGGWRQAATWLNPVNWLPATRFDTEIGLQQLATMIRSGLSLLPSLKTASEQVRRPAMRRVWQRVYERIESGSSFADALTREHRRFPQVTVQLVRVGESSGTLETVLTQAADHLERSRSLRTTLLTALMYPALVVLLSVAVTIYLVVSVIPKLRQFIVRQGGRGLPALTQMLLDTTDWLNIHLTTILIAALVLIVALAVLYRIRAARLRMDAMLLRVPVIGGVLRLAGTAAMSRGMSLLLSNGITLLDAIQITRDLLVNRAMRRRLDAAHTAVIEGEPFAQTLLGGREFLPMLGRMAAIGETTGTLDMVLSEAARFHENQLAATVRRFSVLIEPAVILVVGGIVGFVYIAFFLALFAAANGGR